MEKTYLMYRSGALLLQVVSTRVYRYSQTNHKEWCSEEEFMIVTELTLE